MYKVLDFFDPGRISLIKSRGDITVRIAETQLQKGWNDEGYVVTETTQIPADIEDTEDIFNLFGKAGKFPAEIAESIKGEKVLDKGKIELGVQKHGYHEYRIDGDKFDTRLHFRVVPVNEQDTWLVWTGYKQEMLDKKENKGIWDLSEDRFKKLTMQIPE